MLSREEILASLTHNINTSKQQSKVPNKLKIAKIYPKYKKGDENDPTNYRPISNLPTISKSLEKVVHNQIIEHLERNDFISNCQHGFRKERSTQTAISKICEDITSIWGEKKNMFLAFFLT